MVPLLLKRAGAITMVDGDDYGLDAMGFKDAFMFNESGLEVICPSA